MSNLYHFELMNMDIYVYNVSTKDETYGHIDHMELDDMHASRILNKSKLGILFVIYKDC